MRMWRLLLGLVAVAGLFQEASGQGRRVVRPCPDPAPGTGVIVGLVREAATEVPMGFVDIRLIPASEGTGALVQLDESTPGGRFQFCNVPVGSYTVQGYFDQIGGDLAHVTVGPGGTTSLILNLGLAGEGNEPGSLEGTVVDADSGEPLEGVTVSMADSRARAISDTEGKFAFPSVSPDTYALHATRLGYQDAHGSVVVGGSQAVTVQITMATEVIALEPITVTATRRELTYALPGMEELEQRMELGGGEFILQEDIARRNPISTTQMLQGTRVTVMNDGKQIYMGRTLCAPVVYIDDVQITHGAGSSSLLRSTPGENVSDFRLDPDSNADEGTYAAEAVNLIHPLHIQAIEIYPGPASTPGQYLDSRSRCGVILIWTRRGPKG